MCGSARGLTTKEPLGFDSADLGAVCRFCVQATRRCDQIVTRRRFPVSRRADFDAEDDEFIIAPTAGWMVLRGIEHGEAAWETAITSQIRIQAISIQIILTPRKKEAGGWSVAAARFEIRSEVYLRREPAPARRSPSQQS